MLIKALSSKQIKFRYCFITFQIRFAETNPSNFQKFSQSNESKIDKILGSELKLFLGTFSRECF